MIRESQKLVWSDKTGQHQSLYFCRKCELPILNLGPEFNCPSCGSVDWIEFTHV